MTLKIQKASEIQTGVEDNFMVVGPPGSGKTKLAGTLPGKTLVSAFDPSAKAGYAGLSHVDLIEYPVDTMEMSVTVKRAEGKKSLTTGASSPMAYANFASDFIEIINKGIFAEYDNWIIDTTTTFEAIALDAVMYKNGTFGHVPKLDDYPPAMQLTTKLVRALTPLPIRIVLLMHDELVQDETTKRMENQMLMTGKLKRKLPVLFNHLLRTEVSTTGTGEKLETQYNLVTKSNPQNPYIRTSFKNLPARIDVTIGNFSKPQEYGLGKIIKEQK